MNDQCTRAQTLAGAIALDEATAAERDEYRRHICECGRCMTSLGGEREIERVMSSVREARDAETWSPVPVRYRDRSTTRGWHVEVLALAVAVAIAIGVQSAFGASVLREQAAPAPEGALTHAQIFHVALDSRPPSMAKLAPRGRRRVESAPRMLVLHNVISRRGDHVTQTTVATTEVAQAPIPQITAPPSNVPIWRRDEAMPVEGAATAPTAAPLSGRAESLAVVPVVRDVEPLGGDAAIAPHPGLVAYEEDAYGTTAFEVTVDERGAPVKCDITKSSGFGSLDQSVCRAAMKARYAPRTLNGRPTSGVYRDAFTFRQLGGDQAPTEQQ